MFHNLGPLEGGRSIILVHQGRRWRLSSVTCNSLRSRLEYTLQIFTGFLPIEECPLLDGGAQAGSSRLV